MTTTSVAIDTGRTDLRAWALGWLGGPVIGIADGVLRRAAYEKPLGEPAAHHVSDRDGAAFSAGAALMLWHCDRRPTGAGGDDAQLR